MPTEIKEPEVKPSVPDTGIPPIYGRCPACGKALRPIDLNTGKPMPPKVNAGSWSRALCRGCGVILEYVGNGRWVIWNGKPNTGD